MGVLPLQLLYDVASSAAVLCVVNFSLQLSDICY